MSDGWPDRLNNEFLELKLLKAPIWLMTFKFKAFTLQGVEAINRALDYLDAQPGELGLITTSNHPTIYSAGIDFTQFGVSRQYTIGFLMQLIRLFGRMLSLSYPTVAAINGHCMAGGIMFAMSCDFRVHRKDMGTICLTEINMGYPIPPGMMYLIRDKVPPKTLMMLAQFGQKFNPTQSLEAGLVDQLCEPKQEVEQALKILEPLVEKSSARGAFGQIKQAINRRAIDAAYTQFIPPENLLVVTPDQKL